jgi:hypothetical protein
VYLILPDWLKQVLFVWCLSQFTLCDQQILGQKYIVSQDSVCQLRQLVVSSTRGSVLHLNVPRQTIMTYQTGVILQCKMPDTGIRSFAKLSSELQIAKIRAQLAWNTYGQVRPVVSALKFRLLSVIHRHFLEWPFLERPSLERPSLERHSQEATIPRIGHP